MLTSTRDLLESIILLVLLTSASWTTWRLQRDGRLTARRRILLGLSAIAVGLGLCLVPHEPGPGVRVVGFPLPLVIFRAEHGRWVSAVDSPWRIAFIGWVNVLLVAGVVHAVARLFMAWRSRAGAPRNGS